MLALTRPGIDVSMPRGILIPLQLLAVLGLAELSYRYVEQPLPAPPAKEAEEGRCDGCATHARRCSSPCRRSSSWWAGAGSSWRAATGASTPSWRRLDRRTRQGHGGAQGPRRSRAPRVVALGDSVMIAAKERLAARLGPRFSMNARVGRQADEFVEIAEGLEGRRARSTCWSSRWAANGPLYGEEMEELREATRKVGDLILVNDDAPVSWLDESNAALAEAAETWPHTTLVDWASVACRPREADSGTGSTSTPPGRGLHADGDPAVRRARPE